MIVRGRRGPWRFSKALPSEDSGEHSERQGEDQLARGKGLLAIHGVLDRELGPCAGIALRGAPTRISENRELSDTLLKNHRGLHSLPLIYSTLALTFRIYLS